MRPRGQDRGDKTKGTDGTSPYSVRFGDQGTDGTFPILCPIWIHMVTFTTKRKRRGCHPQADKALTKLRSTTSMHVLY